MKLHKYMIPLWVVVLSICLTLLVGCAWRGAFGTFAIETSLKPVPAAISIDDKAASPPVPGL